MPPQAGKTGKVSTVISFFTGTLHGYDTQSGHLPACLASASSSECGDNTLLFSISKPQ